MGRIRPLDRTNVDEDEPHEFPSTNRMLHHRPKDGRKHRNFALLYTYNCADELSSLVAPLESDSIVLKVVDFPYRVVFIENVVMVPRCSGVSEQYGLGRDGGIVKRLFARAV